MHVECNGPGLLVHRRHPTLVDILDRFAARWTHHERGVPSTREAAGKVARTAMHEHGVARLLHANDAQIPIGPRGRLDDLRRGRLDDLRRGRLDDFIPTDAPASKGPLLRSGPIRILSEEHVDFLVGSVHDAE